MLARLSIRDIVLIDRLDIDFGSGLAALTGETGAGKSILLDAFALALGARGDTAMVREGAEQGQVIAAFDLANDHPARRLLAENDLGGDDDALIVRRVQFADGRTRAFINDQPVSVQVLRALGAALVEIHGQHDERAFVDATTHRALLDAYGDLEGDAAVAARLWDERRARESAVAAHRAEVERLSREAEWLRHAVDELTRLAPETGEETMLAARRTAMMQAERVAEDLRATHDNVSGPQSPVPALSTAVRRLERRVAQAPALIEPVVKALDAALTALDDASNHLERALQVANYDPNELELIEEKLGARGAVLHAVEPRGDEHVVPGRQVVEQARLVGDERQPAFRVQRLRRQIEARDPDVACARRDDPRHATKRGRLARAVGPDEPQDLTLRDGQAQAFDRVHGAVRLAQPIDLDHRSPAEQS